MGYMGYMGSSMGYMVYYDIFIYSIYYMAIWVGAIEGYLCKEIVHCWMFKAFAYPGPRSFRFADVQRFF